MTQFDCILVASFLEILSLQQTKLFMYSILFIDDESDDMMYDNNGLINLLKCNQVDSIKDVYRSVIFV